MRYAIYTLALIGAAISGVVLADVSTIAGSGVAGHNDGASESSRLNRPHGMAQNAAGIIFFADRGNHMIRYFDPENATVSTLAGNGTRGFADGDANTAAFNQPVAVEVGRDGTVYVADRDNHRIRAISASGDVRTLAGSGIAGYEDGKAATSKFNEPYGVALNTEQTKLYVADYLNHAVRSISLADGRVTTVAGNGEKGFADGTGTNARFSQPYNIVLDETGVFYIPDQKNHAVRMMTETGTVTTVAGSGLKGHQDGDSADAKFNNPTGVAARAGVVYVTDRNNHRIRRIAQGRVVTVAGTGTDGGRNGGDKKAEFSKPLDLIFDIKSGAVIISEDTGHRLRKLD
ncbi:MAG: hypothetical protein AAF493_12925 [Pseudomonadota bacterium]